MDAVPDWVPWSQQLEAEPLNWQLRLVFADWLTEREDRFADGFRAIGRLRVRPLTLRRTPRNGASYSEWYWVNENVRASHPDRDGSILAEEWLAAALPLWWCQRLHHAHLEHRVDWQGAVAGFYGYASSHLDAELMLATAFNRLSSGEKDVLLGDQEYLNRRLARTSRAG